MSFTLQKSTQEAFAVIRNPQLLDQTTPCLRATCVSRAGKKGNQEPKQQKKGRSKKGPKVYTKRNEEIKDTKTIFLVIRFDVDYDSCRCHCASFGTFDNTCRKARALELNVFLQTGTRTHIKRVPFLHPA